MDSPEEPAEDRPQLGSSASTQTARARADAELAPLLPALRAGDPQAFNRLVTLNGGWMLQLARNLLRREEDAQDVTQEAFLTAFRSLDQFLGHSKLSTWLHRVLVNAALMRMRKRKRKSEPVLEGDLRRDRRRGLREDVPLEPPTSWDESPLELVAREEVRQAIRATIDDLPEIHRTILLLRDIEEMDTATVAEQLEVSHQVVKTRLHRARQVLRARISPLLGMQVP